MEFFKIVKIKTTEQLIQEELTLDKLDKLSNLLFNIDAPNASHSKIGGIWGEFTLTRNKIRGGLRFVLTECPNALCWTITTGFAPDASSIVLHLTINRKQKQEEFIEEIEEFLSDHVSCLEKFFLQTEN